MIFFILFIIISFHTSFSQGYLSWAKGYKYTSSSYPICLKKTNENEFVSAGYFFSDNYYFMISAKKFDANGNIIWDKLFKLTDTEMYIFAIEETQKGDYFLVGDECFYGERSCEGFVSKIEKNGNVLWKKNYGGKYHDVLYNIIKSKKDGYILVGAASSNLILYPLNILILKIDEMGNLIWKKVFSSSKGDEAYSLIEDEGYVILSATNNGTPNECDLLIFKISEDGEIIWQKSYKALEKIYGTNIIKSQDANYIVTGYIQNQNFGWQGFISKFNKNGELLWSKVIETESNILGVEETKDGLLCFGVLYDFNLKTLSFILEIDLNGNILKQKVFEFSSHSYISNIAKISEDEFILTGTYSNTLCCDFNMLILKLNLNSENQNLCPFESDINIKLLNYPFEEFYSNISEISKPIEVYDSYWANIEIEEKLELFCNDCPFFKISPKKLADAKINNYYVQMFSSTFGEPPYFYTIFKVNYPLD